MNAADDSTPGPFDVVIAGGGVAALETAFALRALAGESVRMTLVAPEREFVYRPMAVTEPFGRGPADRELPSDIVPELDAELIRGTLALGPKRTRPTCGSHGSRAACERTGAVLRA